eukprot:2286558-Heterocapsa_arctica.AAC.1
MALKRTKLKLIVKTLQTWPVQSPECQVWESLKEEAESIKTDLAVDQPWDLQALKAKGELYFGKRT